MSRSFRRTACALVAVVTAISPISASMASAQDYPPGQGYRDPPPAPPQQGYQYQEPPAPQATYQEPQGYREAPPPQQGYQPPPPSQQGYYQDDAPPPGYDGSRPPPPPVGYLADQEDAAQYAQDQRYEAYAEDWSQRYCVKARSNAAAGAVIGGLFGALLGSSVAGRHDRGAGAFIGGVAGAAGGAAIGDSSRNETSPGCPPGFVVRNGAPAFYYDGYGSSYYYAAPVWYRPWVFYGGRWTYRPYPYHAWYYRHYGYGRPYGGYRGYGGGYRHRRW